jgi:hypothetical protein
MSARSTPLAIAFFVAGVFLVAVAVPVIYSGVGGYPQYFNQPTAPPPKGIIVVHAFRPIFIEPAIFVGIGLLVVGVYLLGQSIGALGIRTRVRGTVPPEVHR